MTRCAGPLCEREAVATGLCMAHYAQRYHGKKLAPLRKKAANDPTRLHLREFANAGGYVYRIYASDGQLLYVGQTKRPSERLATHRQTQPWASYIHQVRVTPYGSPEDAREAEAHAIHEEHPRFNAMRRPPTGPTPVPLREPETVTVPDATPATEAIMAEIEAQVRHLSTCAQCGVQTYTAQPSVYCSGACRTAAYRDRHSPATLVTELETALAAGTVEALTAALRSVLDWARK